MNSDTCVNCDGEGTVDKELYGVVVLETCKDCHGLGRNGE